MIELFLKAIDRLLDLWRIGEKRFKVRYDEIFKPAFAELQSVHADYLAMFSAAAEALKPTLHETRTDRERLQAAIDMLSKLRLALSPVRTKLQVLYDDNYYDHIASLTARERQFLESLHRYFYRSQIIPPGSEHKTAATELVIWLTKYRAGLGFSDVISPLEEAREHCAHRIAHSDVFWRAVVTDFADLRFELALRTS